MPNHASHHHDGAGNASAGSAPTTNAAARPDQVRLGCAMTRRGRNLSPNWDRLRVGIVGHGRIHQ